MKTALSIITVATLWLALGGSPASTAQPQPFGGRGYGGSTYGMPPSGDRANDLARCFEQSVRDRIAEGHYVKNYGFVRNVKTGLANFNPFLDTSKGGRCGEYGEWGMKWIQPCVAQLFGSNAIIDDVFVMEKSSTYQRLQSWGAWNPDALFDANHRATRVVLPDGRRFIVDYWEGVGSGNPRMVPEDEWARKWKKSVGEQFIGVDSGVLIGAYEQLALANFVRSKGEERGLELYRKSVHKDGRDGDLWIKSWKLQPW